VTTWVGVDGEVVFGFGLDEPREPHEAAPSTSNYDAISEKSDAENNPPAGLIAHTAGRDSNGVFRIFDI
jgi:hypothetical protein